MDVFEKVQSQINKVEDAGHAERNKQNLKNIIEINKQLKAELNIDGNVIKFEFDNMPSQGELKALSLFIGRARNFDDLKNAPAHAKVFSNVHECNHIADAAKITLDLHSLIDDMETLSELSLSTQSDGGAFYSESEAGLMFNLSAVMDELQDDWNKFVLARMVKDHQPKEIRE